MDTDTQAGLQLQPVNLGLSLSPPSFHPTLTLRISPAHPYPTSSPSTSNGSGKKRACSPLIYISLAIPEGIFVDPDELGDKLLLYGVKDWALTSIRAGEAEGEAAAEQSVSGSGSQAGRASGLAVGGQSEGQGLGAGRWKAKKKVKVDIERPSLNLHSYEQDLTGHEQEAGEEQEHVFQLRMSVKPHFAGGLNATLDERHTEDADWKWTIEIPLHGRYIPPNESGYGTIRVPPDTDPQEDGIRAGWMCLEHVDVDSAGSASLLPLPKAHLISGTAPIEIHLPTGKMSHQPLVEGVTTLVIWLGWAWLVYKILRVRSVARARARASSSPSVPPESKVKTERADDKAEKEALETNKKDD
ncbi:hypothetical protein I316_04199 [Kwoniella heveanensis BCC8398]|uniref:Protein PBN1 n=1 Tax=Kwoniella heveanensis BCC8398 TaxID=1296120 RepID=A0A1B9GT99_9TREE|nr:hypothetical protein I316_04199 [Kwoniella heveanensis BCC8398]